MWKSLGKLKFLMERCFIFFLCVIFVILSCVEFGLVHLWSQKRFLRNIEGFVFTFRGMSHNSISLIKCLQLKEKNSPRRFKSCYRKKNLATDTITKLQVPHVSKSWCNNRASPKKSTNSIQPFSNYIQFFPVSIYLTRLFSSSLLESKK